MKIPKTVHHESKLDRGTQAQMGRLLFDYLRRPSGSLGMDTKLQQSVQKRRRVAWERTKGDLYQDNVRLRPRDRSLSVFKSHQGAALPTQHSSHVGVSSALRTLLALQRSQ